MSIVLFLLLRPQEWRQIFDKVWKSSIVVYKSEDKCLTKCERVV